MIQAIAFDLDGTLFDRASTIRHLIEQQYHRHQPMLTHIPCAEYIEHFIRLDAHGYVPKDVVYHQLAWEFGLDARMSQALYDDFLDSYHSACFAFPGVVETLDALRAQGLRLGIITNGTAALQLGVLRALSIQPYFDAVLVSETERVRKPDRAMFDRAARRLHALPHECIFVGDHSVVDIQGAREAGWRTIWKRTNIWDAPTVMDATIDGYDELVDAVEAIKIVSVLPVKYPQPD